MPENIEERGDGNKDTSEFIKQLRKLLKNIFQKVGKFKRNGKISRLMIE